MEKMKAYIVTKDSSDGTIKVGDLIWLSENFDLNNSTVAGWLPANEWNIDETNDFECEETKDYFVDVVGKDEILRKRR